MQYMKIIQETKSTIPGHISKERLECIGQLSDVMEVVVEAQQLFNTSKSTNDNTEDEDIEQTEIG